MVSNPFQDGLQVEIAADSSDFTSGIDNAIGKLGGFKTAAAAAGVAVGALATGAMAKAVQSAASFEQAMVEVEKVTNPETAAEMSDRIKEMAETIPLAQEELAGLAADAGRFGIEGSKNIESFTRTVAKMSTATDLATDQAGTALAKLAGITGMPIEEVENLGSSINSLANTMKTSSSEIVESMMQSAGALSNMGASQTEIAGLSAAMNEVFNDASKAGRAMRRLAQEMMDPRKVKSIAQALGMNAEEFKAMRDESPIETMKLMAQTMAENGRGANTLRENLSSFTRTALTNMGNNLEGVNKGLEQSAQAYEENTSLQKEFEASSDTFNAKLQTLRNRFNNIAITIGGQLIPPLTRLLGHVTVAVERFAALNERTNGLAGTATLLGGALLGLVSAGALVAPMFAGIATTLASTLVPALTATAVSIGAVTAPVWLVVGALAALGVAYHQNLFGFRDAVNAVVARIRPLLSSVADTFRNLATRIETALNRIQAQVIAPFLAWLVPIWRQHFSTIAAELSKTVGVWIAAFKRFVQFVQPYVSAFLSAMSAWWNEHGDTVMAIVRPLLNVLKRLFETQFSVITDIVVAALSLMRGDFEGFKQSILSIVNTFTSLIVDAFRWLANTLVGNSVVPEMLSAMLSAFTGFFGTLTNAIRTALQLYVNLWRRALTTVANVVRSALAAIVSAVTSGVSRIVGAITGGMSRLTSAVSSGMSSAKSAVSSGINSMVSTVSSSARRFRSAGASVASSLASGIRSRISSAKSAASSLASSVRSRLPGSDAEEGPLSDLTDTGPALSESIAEGMTDRLREVERASSAVAAAANPNLAAGRRRAQPAAGGDTYDINVTIEGDADEHDVDRGLSRALDAHHIG